MGRFQKGEPRPPGAGRKKGTPNKKTQVLTEKCEQRGLDPFEVLLDLCEDIDPHMKLSAAKELCQYIYPKRKAMEVSGPDGGDVLIAGQDGAKLVEEFKNILTAYHDERRQK